MSRVQNQPPRQREGKPLKCPAHLAYVATFGCLICYQKPVQVHHLLKPYRGTRGASRKAGDDNTVPLCPRHHESLHLCGDEEAFFELWLKSPNAGRTSAEMLFEAFNKGEGDG